MSAVIRVRARSDDDAARVLALSLPRLDDNQACFSPYHKYTVTIVQRSHIAF